MSISLALSNKIRFLSFLAMFSVVAIHCDPLLGTGMQESYSCRLLSWLLVRGVHTWAVPFFFMVSGFFALPPQSDDVLHASWNIYNKKLHTLVYPYLLWSVLGFVLMFPILLLREHFLGYPWQEHSFWAGEGIVGKVDLLFGITSYRGPLHNQPLWFVRLLILLYALSPVWLLFQRWCKWLFLPGMLLVVFLNSFGNATFQHWIGGIGCFFAGICLQQFQLANKRLPMMTFPICIVLAGGFLVCRWYSMPFTTSLGFLLPILFVIAVSTGYDLIQKYLPETQLRFTKRTFWVYCLHQPLCAAGIAVTHRLLGKGDFINCLVLLCLPVIVTAIVLLLGYGMEQLMPKTYRLLTGDR